MALFRFDRDGLHESLQTTMLVKNKTDLTEKLRHWYMIEEAAHIPFIIKTATYKSNFGQNPTKDESFDYRIGWFTQMVTFQYDNGPWLLAGFLSEPLDE